MKKESSLLHSFLLLITAIIWGTSFVAQSSGMKLIGPFLFSFIRYMMGGTVLIPVILIIRRKKDIDMKLSVKYGIGCGIILCAASNFQQLAMIRVSAGKAGFITALYIILVPVVGLFMKKKTGIVIWLCVAMAMVGLYFLCIGRGGGYIFEIADIQLLICALIFSFHIIYIDHANEKGVDGVVMSCVQFYVAGIISALFIYPVDAGIYGRVPSLTTLIPALPAVSYSGLMACGVAYTLQIVGQKGVNPTVASLIMSLESVVSAISGFLILGQRLSTDELIGCVIMFAAIILAELPHDRCSTKTP